MSIYIHIVKYFVITYIETIQAENTNKDEYAQIDCTQRFYKYEFVC